MGPAGADKYSSNDPAPPRAAAPRPCAWRAALASARTVGPRRSRCAIALVPAVLIAGLAAYGAWEQRSHERNLARIPVRVHVNGTRGKSSVTRLIAGGLRAGGVRTLAKTTGTMARMILPNGSEVDVYRVGRPNVIEQTRIVRRAVEERAEALVIECMAVTPEIQPLSELRLIKSTVGVITNCRADHLDVMGPTVDDVAQALAQTCPRGGPLFTGEYERRAILEDVARRRGAAVHVVDEHDVQPAELAGFRHFEHAENVALALAVCGHLGIPRVTALGGMQWAAPDPGALRRHTVRSGDKTIEFVNAFAANDPDSTILIWERLGLQVARPGAQRIVLANCRADRLQRSGQIAELVGRRLRADHVVLSGEGTDLVAFRATRFGLDPARISNLGGLGAQAVYERVLERVERDAIVVGIGNVVGLGEEIALHFSNRAVHHG